MRIGKIVLGIGFILVQSAAFGVDLDGNGLEDEWEHIYNITGLLPGDDSDGDGVTNQDECLAGTDPLDSTDKFAAHICCDLDDNFIVNWGTQPGKSYCLCVQTGTPSNVWSNQSLICFGSGANLQAKYGQNGEPLELQGGVRRDIWVGADPASLAVPTNAPTVVDYLSSLEAPSNAVNTCFTLYRGYLKPLVTGAHTISLSSLGATEFWLSPTDQPQSILRQLQFDRPQLPHSWHLADQQVETFLVAGQSYYFEIRHAVQADGHLSATWEGPGIDGQPIIGSEVLSAWFPESAALPEMTEDRWFARIRSADRDTDGDGIRDWAEIKMGYDPYSTTSKYNGLSDPDALLIDLKHRALVSIHADDSSIPENYGFTAIRIVREAGYDGLLFVGLEVSGSASFGTDYQSLPIAVTMQAGHTEKIINLRTIDDFSFEDDEEVIIRLSTNMQNVVVHPDAPQTVVSIVDNDDTAYIDLAVLDATASETSGEGSAMFRLTRQERMGDAVSFSLLVGGTATLGEDFSFATNITMGVGEAVRDIEVVAHDDVIKEFDEYLDVQLASDDIHVVVSTNQGRMTILENDQTAELQLVMVNDSMTEDGDNAVFYIERSGGNHLGVAVPLSFSGTGSSADLQSMPSAVLLAPNVLTKHVFLKPFDDAILESQEVVRVSIATSPSITVTPNNTLDFSIVDNDEVVIEIVSVDGQGYESNGDPVAFELRREVDADRPITVNLADNGGTASTDDYLLDATYVFMPGDLTATVAIVATDDGILEFPEYLNMRLEPGVDYSVSPVNSTASFVIEDDHEQKELLFLARFEPENDANTRAWGYSTIRLAADRSLGMVNTRFNNLTTPQTASHIHRGPVGVGGPAVESLPFGQVTGHEWMIALISGYAPADVLAALGRGDLYANVHTAQYPGGEIRGQYYQTTASPEFEPPEDAAQDLGLPGIPLDEASRFLQQSTFGPKVAEIHALTNIGITAWINDQMDTNVVQQTFHEPIILAMDAQYHAWEALVYTNPASRVGPSHLNRIPSWWTASLHAPDQLRQRVAFAYSQIFVISDDVTGVLVRPVGIANYYDMLGRNAFGNFRDLIEDVTLHPSMAVYLSMIKNTKGDPVLGTYPDENYAREIMQLFSVGLFDRHLDGTIRLDDNGLPIETYDQGDIAELARVFTGWSYSKTTSNTDNSNFNGYGGAYNNDYPHRSPMKMFQAYHDEGSKVIIGDTVVPAGMSGEDEMDLALDALFHHPNTAPFISRLLIQRLTAASPSRGYIYRVAKAFEDNGNGVRGDMGAVVRAILLDAEARDMSRITEPGSGKLKEPVLIMTHMARALDAYSGMTFSNLATYGSVSGLSTNASQIRFYYHDHYYQQTPLSALSVFNYFDPDLIPSGDLASARKTSPEFSVLSESTVISAANLLYSAAYSRIGGIAVRGAPNGYLDDVYFQRTALEGLSTEEMVDWMNLVFTANSMSPENRTSLAQGLDEIAGTHREKMALHLMSMMPEFATQR